MESTWLDLDSSDPYIRLSGNLVLDSGQCELTLKDPAGVVSYSRRFVREDGATGSLRISFDETKGPKTGVWLLEIGGMDAATAGSYDLTLSNR